jgi:diguanylate cyclase (GGDEF)-like protein
MLPETSLENSICIAEKIRIAINQFSFAHIGKLTASFGVSNVNPNSDANRESLHQVDKALYQAKNQGRNQVVSYESMQ